MQFITVASAALAALPIVSAGSAYIYNECDFDVHAWSVSADGSSDAIAIKAGENWSEEYQKPSVGGVSIKLMNNTDTAGPSGLISQFEYTLDNTIWYDMSNVDCVDNRCPFSRYGWYLDASDASCPTRSCEPDAETCTGAYVLFNDDHNTLSCTPDKDISLYLCATEKPSQTEQPAVEQPVQAAADNTGNLLTEFGIPAHRRRHIRHPHSRRALL